MGSIDSFEFRINHQTHPVFYETYFFSLLLVFLFLKFPLRKLLEVFDILNFITFFSFNFLVHFSAHFFLYNNFIRIESTLSLSFSLYFLLISWFVDGFLFRSFSSFFLQLWVWLMVALQNNHAILFWWWQRFGWKRILARKRWWWFANAFFWWLIASEINFTFARKIDLKSYKNEIFGVGSVNFSFGENSLPTFGLNY